MSAELGRQRGPARGHHHEASRTPNGYSLRSEISVFPEWRMRSAGDEWAAATSGSLPGLEARVDPFVGIPLRRQAPSIRQVLHSKLSAQRKQHSSSLSRNASPAIRSQPRPRIVRSTKPAARIVRDAYAGNGYPRAMKLDIPIRQFGGYIFDCDGTIADTMPIHFRAWTSPCGFWRPVSRGSLLSMGRETHRGYRRASQRKIRPFARGGGDGATQGILLS